MIKVFRVSMEWGTEPNKLKKWNVDIMARDDQNAREEIERSLRKLGMVDARILCIWELVRN